MTLYSTGTLGLVNGSASVTGSGTAWVGVLRPGWLLLIPGEPPVLVQSVQAAGSLTLARPYQGTTRTGVAYDAIATRGELAAFLGQLQTVIAGMQGTIDGAGAGKFADGTVETPGLRFAADEDSGLRRKGANQLALVTGGVDRLEVTAAGAALTGLLTGTAVQQSQIDTTAGRLLKAGAFGMGGLLPLLVNPNVTDNTIAPGLYAYDVALGSTGAPAGVCRGSLLHTRRAATRGETQMLVVESVTAAPVRAGMTWSRARGNGAWSPWFCGGVAGSGSNANGRYVRFADGTQRCTGVATLAYSGVAGILTVIWTYPAAFPVAPAVNFIPRTSGAPDYTNVNIRDMGTRVAYPGTLSAVLNQYSALGATGTWDSTSQITNVAVTAEGHWY